MPNETVITRSQDIAPLVFHLEYKNPPTRYVYYGIQFVCAAQVKKWIVGGHIIENGLNNPSIRLKATSFTSQVIELNYTNGVTIAPNVYEFEIYPPRRVFKNYTLLLRIPYNQNFMFYSQEDNGPVNYCIQK